MDPLVTVLGSFFVLVALNTIVPRTRLARSYPWVFWAINGLNVAVGLVVLLFGVPGFEQHPVVRLVLGLAILMHLAQNFAVKSRWDSEERLARLEEEEAERASLDDR